MPKVFLSYRRSDSASTTGRIYDKLTTELGKTAVFKDVDSIPLGEDFAGRIDAAVGECEVFVAIIGPRWLEAGSETGQRRLDDPDDFVRLEIEAALRRKIRVIPVLVGGAKMPGADELPASVKALARRQATSVREDPDFHNDVNRLVRGVTGKAGQRGKWAAGLTLAAAVVTIVVGIADLPAKIRGWWSPSEPPGSGVATPEAQGSVPATALQVLEGEILDEATRVPLAGVTVTLPEYNLRVVTDSFGKYRFEVLAPPLSLATLRAAKDGYQPLNRDFTLGTGNLDKLRMQEAP